MRFSRFAVVVLIMILPWTPGCAKLTHLRELLVIKSYSENKDAQERAVQDQNARFRDLLEAVRHGGLGRYPDQAAFLQTFGPPVLREPDQVRGAEGERWLYREAVNYFDSEKVYLFFDREGRLAKWDHVPAPDGEAGPGTPPG